MAHPFLPNSADATISDQAEPDSVDFDTLVGAHAVTGVVSGCVVSEDPTTPDMTVDVAAGVVRSTGKPITVSAQANNAITAADGSNLRIDLVSINSSGTVVVTDGTPAANAVAPAIPATSVPLAFVYVPASDTTITDNQIVDKAIPVPAATVFNVKWYGATGDGSTDDTAAIQAAIDAAEVNGGVVYFPTADYVTGALTLEGNERVSLIGNGSTLLANANSQTTLTINRSYGNTATASRIDGFLFDENAKTGVTAIEIEDTDRVRFTNIDVIGSFDVGFYFHIVAAAAQTEGCVLQNVYVSGCDKGIVFTAEAAVTNESFAQTMFQDVGVTDFDTGIEINDGCILQRSHWRGVTLWASRANAVCLDWDGMLDKVDWHIGFESLDGTTPHTAVLLNTNFDFYSDNFRHTLDFRFEGSFEDEIDNNSSSKGIMYKQGGYFRYDHWSVPAFGAWKTGDTNPTLIVDGTGTFTLGDNSVWPAVKFLPVSGSPEGATSASPGSQAFDYTNGDIYVKNTGTGNTGWVLVHAGSALDGIVTVGDSATTERVQFGTDDVKIYDGDNALRIEVLNGGDIAFYDEDGATARLTIEETNNRVEINDILAFAPWTSTDVADISAAGQDTLLFTITETGVSSRTWLQVYGPAHASAGDIVLRSPSDTAVILTWDESDDRLELSKNIDMQGNTIRDVNRAVEYASSPTLDWDDHIVSINSAASTRAVTLPSCATYNGHAFFIQRDGGNNVTIDPGTDTFSDTGTSTDKTLGSDGAAIGLYSVGGTEWKVAGTEGTVT